MGNLRSTGKSRPFRSDAIDLGEVRGHRFGGLGRALSAVAAGAIAPLDFPRLGML
jgi:hypothetical protein